MKVTMLNRTSWSLTLVIATMFATTMFAIGLPFAGRVQADQTTISSLNDGELDEHINWANFTKGSPDGCFQSGCKFMYAGRLADDYGNPVVGPSKFAAMKFDVSSLAGQTITGATLRLIQTFDPAASVTNERTLDLTVRGGMVLAPTTEVYAVNSGEDFDELFSSWNSYTNGLPAPTDATRNAFLNSGAISPLGSMTNVVNPGGISGPGAPVTFTDTDLTALVQSWVNNSSSNLGLLLLNSATFTGAPAGPGDIVARYATHESGEITPGHIWDPPQLIITFGSTGLPGDFNSDNKVDAADYTNWRDNLGAADESSLNGNGNGMNGVDTADYNLWTAHFGEMASAGSGTAAVPEPNSLLLALVGALAVGQNSCRRRYVNIRSK